MKTVFNIFNGGQDGTDGGFLCAVSDSELATRVAVNQGSMGVGPGKIQEIQVFESFEELPEKMKSEIIKHEDKINSDLHEALGRLTAEQQILLKEYFTK